jgi:NHL repeat
LLRVAKTTRFSYPTDIAVDNAGTVHIANTNNQTIRMGIFLAAPTIAIHPQSQTATAGSNVQFPVIHKNAAGLMAGQKRFAGAA